MAKVTKTLKTVTIYHGKGQHTDTIADTQTEGYGSMALALFLGGKDIAYNNLFIMYPAICHVEVEAEEVEIDIDDKTCESDEPTPGNPRIEGADNVRINQGIGIDLAEGVHAYDGDGNEIPFTFSPDEIDPCDIGVHEITYTAEGVTKGRKVTIVAISDPVIDGLTDLTAMVGDDVDPLEGVSATDGNGNEIEVRVVA